MPSNQREELTQITLVARLYYENGWTQEQIAREVGISRPMVSRLLQRAREKGIVCISISDPYSTEIELSEKICQATNLTTAIVAGGMPTRNEFRLERLGITASVYLQQVLQPNEWLGVGWGRTLYALSQALDQHTVEGLTIVPLLGGLGEIAPSFQVHEIARKMAEAYQAVWQPFYAPALVDDPKVRESLMTTTDLQYVLEAWSHLTTVVVGIGNIDFDVTIAMLFASYLDEQTRALLRSQQAVGDICMRFFNRHGQPILQALQGVNGITLEQFQRVKRRIAVAGGAGKAQAILGAIRGQYIDTLVTDESAANEILRLIESGY